MGTLLNFEDHGTVSIQVNTFRKFLNFYSRNCAALESLCGSATKIIFLKEYIYHNLFFIVLLEKIRIFLLEKNK